MAAKQRGKKQGKRIVKPSDGFVSVAYDGGRDSSIVKTLAAVTKNAAVAERLKRPQEGLNNPPVAGRYRYVMQLVVLSVRD